MKKAKLTRRQFVATSAAASAMVAAPFVRTAHAAGKLSIMFWDHWVPGGNNASKALCEEWGAKDKVDVQIDYVTSQGHKNLLTIAAESQAKSGHDILAFPTWQPADHANNLEPVDDVMAELIKQHGKVNPTVEYLARSTDKWLAVPPPASAARSRGPARASTCSSSTPASTSRPCIRPAVPPKADAWTSMPSSRRPRPVTRPATRSASASARPRTIVDTAGAIFAVLRRRPGRRQGQDHRQVRRRCARRSSTTSTSGPVAAARCAGLGRRLQQQVPGRPARAR